MTASATPRLTPGHVYRTRDLARWSANPTRLAGRLVRDGALVRLRHGLFAAPRRSRFGLVPPTDEALLDAFLGGGLWLVTGPPRWNALGLGATAVFALPLVYNTKRSGVFDLGGRSFMLRRVRFPADPTPEWFAVDLLSNAGMAGVGSDAITDGLRKAVAAGRFDPERLRATAREYATRQVQARVEDATA